MKSEFEPQDIQLIAEEVVKLLKPLLVSNGKHEEDIIFDVNGLAKYLCVTTKWIYEQTHLNTIPFHKIGNQLRFRKKEIDKWFDSTIAPPTGCPTKKIKLIK